MLRILIIVFLILILGSLASALVFLVKGKDRSNRTVKALAIRIALSLLLFAILVLAFFYGAFTP
ncbi:MAG: twin transmembrane helix small protein [Gammaproteobacteria bacterium]|nr:twin transmembrane helix small protein [Gammaproteobacteria bacterium]